ncbi:hypothetical protein J7E79_00610 [Bacillus sp. ISL-40]|uniref:hypothetical protein n=1 Tax=unclassified Bacillus (in: firmicutes) TaxID=185979 RepID=UPI001BED240D|nr:MULTISPECIES: hypothetical protein [unclassified Bacillus (in: firmicutes)]MBT2695947.1 hypothetical protein [Bacillus sp. ISL-40]MBT2739697.1 hypothetical protein [Bacillus sp. ISL-77]
MFKINFHIEDSPKLRSWLTEPDFDPALHLNGFIDITYRENNFFLNYLQTPSRVYLIQLRNLSGH